MKRNKREFSRIEVSWPVCLRTPEESIDGEVRNISLGGALIHCRKLPDPDKPLELSIEIPEYVFPVSATVEKVRLNCHHTNSASPAYDLAVRFTGISDADLTILCKAVESEGRTRALRSGATGKASAAKHSGLIKSMEKLSRDLNRPFRELVEEAMRDLVRKYQEKTSAQKGESNSEEHPEVPRESPEK